jgi:hypothetical protein
VINGTSDGQGTIRIYRNSHSFGGEYTSVTSSPQGTWSWTPGVSDFGSFYATFQKENTRESDLTEEIVVQKLSYLSQSPTQQISLQVIL